MKPASVFKTAMVASLLWTSCAQNEENPIQTMKRDDVCNDMDYVGILHNEGIDYLTTTGAANMEEMHASCQNFMEMNSIAMTLSLPEVVNMCDLIGTYTFFENIDQSSLSSHQKEYLTDLGEIVEEHYDDMNAFTSAVESIECIVTSDDNMTDEERDIVLGACSVAIRSGELWTGVDPASSEIPKWVWADIFGYINGGLPGAVEASWAAYHFDIW